MLCTALGVLLSAAPPASAQINDTQVAELRDAMTHVGSLRLIVTVSTEQWSGDQPAAAKANQQEVLRALTGTEHQVALVFPSTPLIALVVGRDALDVLIRHPLVTSIMIDQPRGPSARP
jgi:hypothetical protein